MNHIVTIIVSSLGGAVALALVSNVMAHVVQPANIRNNWKNALLTSLGVVLAVSLVVAAQQQLNLQALPFVVQAVAAALIVFGALTALVIRMYRVSLEEAVTMAPVIGTTSAAICGMVLVAFSA